ncbi:hypothetical protein ACFXKF_34220 [Streptomyces scopuliridis]|uniref:hypothetical protein n=1 Tax=Streptomyces scopuliridis TaxID=452529 RepID=UPI0036A2F196
MPPAETEGREADARGLFLRAWGAAGDDYEACVAAHYLAPHQPTPEETLRWNQECPTRADRVGDERVRGFHASPHGNMGQAQLALGGPGPARAHFRSAAEHLDDVPPGPYREWVQLCVARGLRATDDAPRRTIRSALSLTPAPGWVVDDTSDAIPHIHSALAPRARPPGIILESQDSEASCEGTRAAGSRPCSCP